MPLTEDGSWHGLATNATIACVAWEWVGPLATGAVGTSSIAVTVWLAHKTLRIQAERAMKSDRRALYARLLQATYEMRDCAIRLCQDGDQDNAQAGEWATAFRNARASATAALAEISISSPASVEEAARNFLDLVLETALDEDDLDLPQASSSLIAAMRKDVG